MSISKTSAKDIRSIAGKVVLALAFASIVGGVSLTPALADNDDWKQKQNRGQHRAEGYEDRDRVEYRYYGYQPYNYNYYNYTYRPYTYYAPPPVVYAPPYQSPGLNFVFPLTIR